MEAIGIDIGGTNIKGVLLDQKGNIIHDIQVKTNETESAWWKNAVKDAVGLLSQKASVEKTSIGISAPGLANDRNECIRLMPGRLQGLENFIWSDFLKAPALVLNDAHAALMAEAKFGAGKGFHNIVMLTLGTGVGGGLLINGQLHQGMLNRAGHLGHITLHADSDVLDITQMPGSLEDAIGDCTIGLRSQGKFNSTSALVQAHQKGDPFASQIWLLSIRRLAVALCSFINILSPEIIILGGGIAQAGDDLFKPLEQFMDIFEWRYNAVRTPVVRAAFDEYSGAVGAAAFALHPTISI